MLGLRPALGVTAGVVWFGVWWFVVPLWIRRRGVDAAVVVLLPSGSGESRALGEVS